MGKEIGPMMSEQLKQMAVQKLLSPDDVIRKGASGKWTPASRVKGLFDASVERSKEPIRPSSQIAAEVVERNLREEPARKPSRLTACPDCDRLVSLQALTCPQCGRQMKEEIHYEQKSRGLAVALAWLIGMTGAHRHYMSESHAWLYLLGTIFVIGIPFVAIASLLDGFRYLSAEDEYFKVAPRDDHGAGPHQRARSDSAGNSSGSWVRKLGFLIVIIMGASMIMSIVDSTEQPTHNSQTSNSSRTSQKWYEGGTLHDKMALDWQKATSRNKLATCSDFVAAVPQIANNISHIDDIKPFAINLVKFIDEAFAKDVDPELNRRMFANQKITTASAVAFISWGWKPE